jgi:hypothetical protein
MIYDVFYKYMIYGWEICFAFTAFFTSCDLFGCFDRWGFRPTVVVAEAEKIIMIITVG